MHFPIVVYHVTSFVNQTKIGNIISVFQVENRLWEVS